MIGGCLLLNKEVFQFGFEQQFAMLIVVVVVVAFEEEINTRGCVDALTEGRECSYRS